MKNVLKVLTSPMVMVICVSVLVWLTEDELLEGSLPPSILDVHASVSHYKHTLWDLDRKCFRMLYGTKDANCGCGDSHMTHDVPVLQFEDGDGDITIPAQTLPLTYKILVTSGQLPCGDVIEGAFSSLETNITIPARVVALKKGAYEVCATFYLPGIYQLRVRMLWSTFMPSTACPNATCRKCFEDSPRRSGFTLRKTITVRPEDDLNTEPKTNEVRPCRNMEDIMDGRMAMTWNFPKRFDDGFSIPSYTHTHLRSSWVPNSCALTAFKHDALQEIFRGLRIHFIGDSTMRNLLLQVQELFYPNQTAQNDTQWGFSFIAGDGGLAPFLNNTSTEPRIKDRFMDSIHAETDLVILGAGTHQVAYGQSIQQFDDIIPIFFRDVVRKCPKIARDRRRLVWRSALPLIAPISNRHWPNGLCSNDANAGIYWLNLLSAKHASAYDSPILDAHRLCFSENQGLEFHGYLPCTLDGLHFNTCGCVLMQAIAVLHYFTSILGS